MQNEREVAVNILLEIEKERGYSGIVLSRNLNRKGTFDARSRGFITEVVLGCMRNLIFIDFIIDKFSKIHVAKMEPFIRHLLRVSVYQIKFMDRIPISAAVNEAVKLAKHRSFAGLVGFVNAVLRNIARADTPLPDKATDLHKYLSIKYSFPLWIVEYYLDRFGIETAEKICKAAVLSPSVQICINTTRTSRDELLNSIEAEPLGGNGAQLLKSSDITKLKEFQDGFFHVMGENSMKAVETLDPQPGEVVMDLCAAPGGKSFYCSYLMKNNGTIHVWDIHPHKIDLINDSAKRLGAGIVVTKATDARLLKKEFISKADRVLIDAPCTGLGVVCRKPDIKYYRTKKDIHQLAILQREILNVGWQYVKPSGILVYSTCTLTHAENEKNTAWFLKNFPFELESETLLLPDRSDGFYVARFKKRG